MIVEPFSTKINFQKLFYAKSFSFAISQYFLTGSFLKWPEHKALENVEAWFCEIWLLRGFIFFRKKKFLFFSKIFSTPLKVKNYEIGLLQFLALCFPVILRLFPSKILRNGKGDWFCIKFFRLLGNWEFPKSKIGGQILKIEFYTKRTISSF